MNIFTTQLVAAKEKIQDSLQATIQADITKIEDFLTTKMFVSQADTPVPSKARGGRRRSITDTKRLLTRSAILRDFYARKEKSLPTLSLLSEWNGVDIDLLNPKKYTFGYLLYASGIIYRDYATNKPVIASDVGDGIRPFLMAIDLSKPASVSVIQGKIVDLNLVYFLDQHDYPQVSAYFAIKADPSRFKAALNSLKAKDTGADLVLSNIYHNLVNDRPVPPFFSKKISFTNSFKPGSYVSPSGRISYIPDMEREEQATAVQQIRDALSGKLAVAKGRSLHLPKNVILFPDADTNTLVCTDMQGGLCSYSIAGLVPPDNKIKLSLLNKKITFFFDSGAGGLSSYLPISYSDELAVMMDAFYMELGRDVDLTEFVGHPKFLKFIDACIEYGHSRYGNIKLSNWMTFMGLVHTLRALRKDAKGIAKEVNAKKTKFDSRTPDDAPAIPNMRKDAIQFPHQAIALSQLDVAEDSAVLDVGTGGGKAGILIQDCLNLLNDGRIRRPLIIMPNSLVSQFLSEIAFFTDNQVNGFALTTSVEKGNDLDDLASRVRNAPANTIFVTSFSWLTKGGSVDDYDLDGNVVKTYEATDWVKQNINPDYVAVDESQNIKNMKSEAFKAVQAVSRGVRRKRIATGTLISNKPEDIVGQLMFLDPLLVGTRAEFEKRYYVDGNPKKGPKANMAEEIRARLRSGSSYIMFREKDWAPLLPKKVYSFSRVEQTPEQAKVYKMLVTEVMDEIKSDPKLAKAWQAMQDEGDSLETVPTQLLGKLARLEIFLTAPDSSRLLKYAKAGGVSPKIAEIDRLIDKSLKMPGDNKVIVAVHYKSGARHLLANSKHKNIAAYYDASRKDLIAKFQDPKSNLKVLFAVGQSIKEGLNLQVANRIITADVDWTPGALKQLEARIFRPHVKIKNGEVVNLNEGKTVYIDTVIADDSADCVKYAFQSYKKVLNSIIMEGCPVDTPRRVPFSEDALSAKFTDPIINGNDLLDKIDQYNAWNQEEIDTALKKGDLKFRPVKHAKSNIGTEEIQVPWIKGMVLPAKDDEEPLLTYLDTLGVDTDEDEDDEVDTDSVDLTSYEADLMGIRVRVEQGEGRIYSVRKGSVLVRLNSGTNVSAKPALVLHKIGSVARGLTRKEIRTGISRKETLAQKIADRIKKQNAKALKKAPVNTDPGQWPTDSREPRDIKGYLRSVGVKYARQQSKTTGENRCILRYDGNELAVKTKFFKDLPLGTWMDYADRIRGGETGIIDPAKETKATSPSVKKPKAGKDNLNTSTKTPKVEKEVVKKAPKTPKVPVKDAGGAVKETKAADALDAYLDDDFDFFTPEEKTPKKGRASRSSSKPVKVSVKMDKAGKASVTHEDADSGLPVQVASYNNIPSLVSFTAEGNEELEDLGFLWSGKYWSFRVTSLNRAKRMIENITDKYRLPKDCATNIQQVLSEFKRGVYKTAFPEEGLKSFLLKNRKKARVGTLRLYPLVVGTNLFFVADVDKHPGITLTTFMFKRKKGYYIYSAPTLAALRAKFRAVMKVSPIANIDQVKTDAWEHLKIRVG